MLNLAHDVVRSGLWGYLGDSKGPAPTASALAHYSLAGRSPWSRAQEVMSPRGLAFPLVGCGAVGETGEWALEVAEALDAALLLQLYYLLINNNFKVAT